MTCPSTTSSSAGGRLTTEYRGLLLDLDGTLVDTAPDMVRVLDALCDEHGVPRVAYPRARNQISNGVNALLELAFPSLEEPLAARLRARFLVLYAQRLAVASRLFPGIAELLTALDRAPLPWGVVTNKPAALTEPLLRQLGIAARAGCIVSGDSTTHSKPHPEPLLHASRLLGLAPDACIYVGDAERDVRAGGAARMFTVVAAYGYIEDRARIAAWRADAVIEHPRELLRWLALGPASGAA